MLSAPIYRDQREGLVAVGTFGLDVAGTVPQVRAVVGAVVGRPGFCLLDDVLAVLVVRFVEERKDSVSCCAHGASAPVGVGVEGEALSLVGVGFGAPVVVSLVVKA